MFGISGLFWLAVLIFIVGAVWFRIRWKSFQREEREAGQHYIMEANMKVREVMERKGLNPEDLDEETKETMRRGGLRGAENYPLPEDKTDAS